MAEAIAFNIAAELIIKFSSPALSQVGLWWNLKHDLDDLKSIVSTIKAVLLHAEEKSVTDNLIKVWLEELKDVLYDADHLLDDFSAEALRKDLLGGNKLTKEVRLFFSSSNRFAYGLKMARKIKAIKARLASIEREANTFCFIPRDRSAETSFMTKKRQETHSFEREDEIIGRDADKAALLKLVLEFQSEENVYIIPIVGFGGLGKTALVLLVYNDEMVKSHFELTMFVCVSNVFDVKVIVANIIKSVTNQAPDQNLEMDQLQKQLRDKIDGKKYLLILDDIWNEDPEQWSRLKKLLMEKFKAANLKEKQHLRSLELAWARGNGDDEKSLEYLQPHPNLKELRIVGWGGDAKFPSWLSLLTNLVAIRIWWGNFKHLPSIAQLPCLKHLHIYGCTELEYMDDNSPKGSQGNREPFFPSLKVLFLLHCPNMKSWWRTIEAIGDDSNEDGTTVTGTSTMAFPCLSYLEIENCPLTSMPLYPSLDHKLKLVNTSSRPLKQTMKMNMNAKTPSSSTSSLPLSKLKYFHVDNIEGLDTHTLHGCLQHLINLQGLSLINFPNLTSLPDEMRCLTNLQRSMEEPKNRTCILHQLICPWHCNLRSLSLAKIPQCRHLPDWVQHLTNLQFLYLSDLPNLRSVPQLEERYRKYIGADWHKIAHIANIKISGCYQVGLSLFFIYSDDPFFFFEEISISFSIFHNILLICAVSHWRVVC
ncbi:hypothetical protein GOBAR_DD04768 [Gossypium barbadense]|nr:hypothetical protein GOBAR_DD04768 [Gossypium barbadense]